MGWKRNLASVATAILAVALAGIPAGAADTNVDITVTPEVVDFGRLPVGSVVAVELVVSNTGPVEVILGAIGFSQLDGKGGFFPDGAVGTCAPTEAGAVHLAPGESCVATLSLIVAGRGRGMGDFGVEAYGLIDGQFELETSLWKLVAVGSRAQA